MGKTLRHLVGFHAVTARLRQHPQSVREIYVDTARRDQRARDLLERATAAGVTVHSVEGGRLHAMAGGDRHQGVVAMVDDSLPRPELDDILSALAEPALLLVLDGVTDPHNLGACLRTADAAGVDAVVVPKAHSAPLTAAAIKAATGAVETVPLVRAPNLARTLTWLKEAGVWAVGADADAPQSLHAAKLAPPIAIVLGGEGRGLRRLTRDTCDELVSIPMAGAVASLNVSVATGIVLFELLRQAPR